MNILISNLFVCNILLVTHSYNFFMLFLDFVSFNATFLKVNISIACSLTWITSSAISARNNPRVFYYLLCSYSWKWKLVTVLYNFSYSSVRSLIDTIAHKHKRSKKIVFCSTLKWLHSFYLLQKNKKSTLD